MKVFIYSDCSFVSSHLFERFKKEGSKAYVVDRCESNITFDANYTKKLENIVKSEKPDAIIFVRTEPVLTIEDLNETTTALTTLLELSVKLSINKFILLSSILLYPKHEGIYNEESPIAPAMTDEMCYAVCEDLCRQWRISKHLSTVILRCGEIYGYRQSSEDNHIIWRLIDSIYTNKYTGVGNTVHNIINIGDITEAVLKSTGSFVSGVFNIAMDNPYYEFEIVTVIAQHLNISIDIQKIKCFDCEQKIDNSKAKRLLSWSPIIGIENGIQKYISWYIEYKKSESVHNRKKAIVRIHNIPIIKNIENILFFLIAAYITYYKNSIGATTSLDFMVIYIIAIGIFYGLNHSIVAAILSGLLNIVLSVISGSDLSSVLYNFSTLMIIVEYLIIGTSIGYVVKRKDFTILLKENEIKRLSDEQDNLTQLYDELLNVKDELEYRITQYDDSFGKILSIISKIDILEPEEIFINSLEIFKELMHENNISLYLVDNKNMFMRKIGFIGQEYTLLPNSVRLRDYPKWEEIVTTGDVYANRYLDNDMPSMVAPVIYKGKVVSVVVIHHMSFEKMSLYYLNMLKVIAGIINSAFFKAYEYELVSMERKYVDGTHILKADEFVKKMEIKERLQKKAGFLFSVLRLRGYTDFDEMVEVAFNAQKVIRNNDEIGLNKDGELCLILSGTSQEHLNIVVDRLSKIGIASEPL